MSTLARLRSASAVVVAVHAVKTACALALVSPTALALAPVLDAGVDPSHSYAARWLHAAAPQLRDQLAALLLSAGAYALLAPILTQWLLASLATQSTTARGALRTALTHAPRALAWCLLRWLSTAAVLGVAALAWRYAPPQLAPSAWGEDLARLAIAGSALGGVLWLSTAHDLGAAALSRGTTSFAKLARESARVSTLACCARRLTFVLAASACGVAAELAARWVPSLLAAPEATLALQQSLALAATFTSAAWLADAARTSQPEQTEKASRSS